MATVTYIRETKQHLSAMRTVMRYCMREDKTWDSNSQSYLISGVNCNGANSISEFVATKAAHGKTDGMNFYQYVQSFSDKENITHRQAHEIALEFAARAWPGAEVLVATHCDTDNVHSHFVINSVLYESGLKLRQSPGTLKHLRGISDQVCQAHGFSVLNPYTGGGSKVSAREWRAAQKGESWKFQLMYVISESMKRSCSKEDFTILMKRRGYDMVWTDTRKEITFICPNGMKCRGGRLHHEKYAKENFEYEFKLREQSAAQYLSGQAGSDQRTGHGNTGSGSVPTDRVCHPEGMAYSREGHAGAGNSVSADTVSADWSHRHEGRSGTDDGYAAGTDSKDQRPDDANCAQRTGTGWERERGEFFRNLEAALGQSHRMASDGGATGKEDHQTADRDFGSGSHLIHSCYAGLSALAELMEDYPDSTDDPEERRRRIEARIEAENFGAIVGVTIGVASVIVDRLANRAQTPEQAEELEILEQEEYNEYRAQNELWQQNM